MAIKKIKICNFKSFNNAEIDFNAFNCVIGANAAGKSNFLQIFQFMKQCIDYGLDNAISMQGGINYLCNINIGSTKPLYLLINFDFEKTPKYSISQNDLIIKIIELIYEFEIKFNKNLSYYLVKKDKLILKTNFYQKLRKPGKKEVKLSAGEIIINNTKGDIDIQIKADPEIALNINNIFSPFLYERKLRDKKILAESSFFSIPIIKEIFTSISIYNINPRLSKAAIPITGKAELEEDGSNLPIILKKILSDKQLSPKFFNLLNELLPFVDNVNIEERVDKTIFLKFKEKYYKKDYLPAFLLSDGTINATAMIITLYFENKPIIIIEEPERNVHPYLMSRIVSMMKDASKSKQIIITTHNPELVKYANIEDIILISRDNKGFSNITKPHTNKDIKIFIKNEIGIEELFIQNLLE
jgi:predicted ATPase